MHFIHESLIRPSPSKDVTFPTHFVLILMDGLWYFLISFREQWSKCFLFTFKKILNQSDDTIKKMNICITSSFAPYNYYSNEMYVTAINY